MDDAHAEGTVESAIAPDQFDDLVDAVTEGPVESDDLMVRYEDDGYVFEVPGLHREHLSVEELQRAAAANAEWVTNWHFWNVVVGGEGTARRAFLRWLEAADEHSVRARYDAMTDGGIHQEWGELLVTVELGEVGYRRYELRHVDDSGADADELTTHAEPRDLRDLSKYDDRGRYRPLKTAPSLVDGWVLPDLTSGELAAALGVVYPATVENWHREREGTLDVSHWRETAERQTGIYDVVEELPREAVEWVTEAACVDSQCLKRREWQYDEDDHLETPGGDGPFPCREPCSLVVAAARKWTTLEEEDEHTYEFDLTPSEKEQLEAIVDAVADDRTDEIREADVYEGANRYRARYLRAKRFDGDGHLCGVPTEE
jgi:hypothetical protein